ncbi:RNA methyltransferase [bacterium]|nr:RNA methyltransferase [bacterium]
MDVITSVNNETVKECAKLQQKKYRVEKFLLEGLKPVKEAISSGLKIDRIFVNQNRKDFAEEFKNFNLILTTEPILKKLSTTETAPEIVAVAYQKKFDVDNLKGLNKVILLENIKDAGNLGTIIRTAKALDFDAVVLYGETVDIYNPKTVRSAVGNLWKLPVVHINDFKTLKNIFGDYERIATLPKSEQKLAEFTPKMPLLLMFGSEADGLTQPLIKFASTSLTIEMNKDVESLNLSISAGIIMYQISSF